MFNLGMLYYEGKGVDKNFQKAAKLFERAVTFPPKIIIKNKEY